MLPVRRGVDPGGGESFRQHEDARSHQMLLRGGGRSGDENRDPLAGVEAAAMVNETGGDG